MTPREAFLLIFALLVAHLGLSTLLVGVHRGDLARDALGQLGALLLALHTQEASDVKVVEVTPFLFGSLSG